MNEATETTTTSESSLIDNVRRLRHYFGGRRGLIVLAVIIVVVAAFFNWGWLVAAGLAPLLLALAPCAAMCALGLCMNKTGGKSCASDAKSGDPGADTMPSATVTSVQVDAKSIDAKS